MEQGQSELLNQSQYATVVNSELLKIGYRIPGPQF